MIITSIAPIHVTPCMHGAVRLRTCFFPRPVFPHLLRLRIHAPRGPCVPHVYAMFALFSTAASNLRCYTLTPPPAAVRLPRTKGHIRVVGAVSQHPAAELGQEPRAYPSIEEGVTADRVESSRVVSISLQSVKLMFVGRESLFLSLRNHYACFNQSLNPVLTNIESLHLVTVCLTHRPYPGIKANEQAINTHHSPKKRSTIHPAHSYRTYLAAPSSPS